MNALNYHKSSAFIAKMRTFTTNFFIMRLLYLIILFISLCNPSFLRAQTTSPYRLIPLRESLLLGGSALSIGTSFYLKQNKPTLTQQQIEAAMANPKCPPWECFVTRNWSLPAQHKSDILMYGAMAMPLTLFLSPKVRANAPQASLIALEAYLLTSALTNLTKELVQRRRPFVYNPNAPFAEKSKHDASSSFFSGHTSYTATACFMTATMYSHYYPNSKWTPYIWTGAALIPLATAYYRVRGGKHFVSDVLVGYLVGAAVGILVPQWHKIRG